MIGYLKGKLLSINENNCLIENNGIGYEVVCSSGAVYKITEQKMCEIFTYLQVREDGLFLYGFESLEEKKMFLKLISVSSVGPKMGITILSSMRINALAIAIATNDTKSLSGIKGVGKKTAERIVLELREKVANESSLNNMDKLDMKTLQLNSEEEDAVMALMTLGFTRAESVKAVNLAVSNGYDSLEKLIANSLKFLN